MEWIEVAKAKDVPQGEMKLVEARDKKITLANVDGSIYAFNDRCPHMSAPLHMGFLKGNVLTCPLHYATFDVATGKKLSDPKMGMPPEMMEKLPKDFLKQMGKMGEVMAPIETHDLETYEVKVEDGRVMVNV